MVLGEMLKDDSTWGVFRSVENTHVIQVNHNADSEDVIHIPMEDSRDITVSERHNHILKIPILSIENHLQFLNFRNTNKN